LIGIPLYAWLAQTLIRTWSWIIYRHIQNKKLAY
jgi:hypothetical protein